MLLSAHQINEFHKTGVIVIENVLSEEEVINARKGLHQQLLNLGIDHYKILSGEQILDEGVRIKGKPAKIFYNKWKMDVHLHERAYEYVKELMTETYFSGKKEGYTHPFGKSDDVLAYVDRICWRLPDKIKTEGGLSLHLDRNPYDPYLLKSSTGLKKWRPIQCFIALTDHVGQNTGGLQVIKGFQYKIDDYFSKNKTENDGDGEFFRMNSKSYTSLQNELETINVSKGGMVLWDNRLPHSTCDKFTGFDYVTNNYDTREVVYCGFLPNVKLNKEYCKQQLEHIVQNIPPPAYFDKSDKSDRNWNFDDLTTNQKRMLEFE